MRTTFLTIVPGLLGLLAAGMCAATGSPVDDPRPIPEQLERDVARTIERFRSARISLQQAIDVAEGLHAGSRAADVSFDGKNDTIVFRVKTVDGKNIWENAIDARSAEVDGVEIQADVDSLDGEARINLSALHGLQQTMSEAVAIAERVTAGKAVCGSLTDEGGKLNFVVIVLIEDELKQLHQSL